MQTFKLDFRNRSAADQLHICEHAVRSITRLKPEERGDVELDKLTATVAGVRTSFDRVIWLRSELKMEIDQRDGRLRAARAQVTSSCSSVSSLFT